MTAPRKSKARKSHARAPVAPPAPFRGRFTAKLDDKGRLLLPAAVRAALGSPATAFVTNSLHQNKPCLHLRSATGWAALERRVARLPSLKPETQAFQRYYVSGGQEVEADAQGRILAPSSLREHADLKDAAVLVGMGEYLEIWSADAWRAIERSLAQSFEATMAAVAAMEASVKASIEDSLAADE